MRMATSRLVAIVGGSGAGKTWLTDRLERIFGEKAARLSLDDFYLDRSHLSAGRRALINYDHPRAMDWPAVEEVLQACRAGQSCRLPRYDFETHTRALRREIWRPQPLVLMEGLWLLLRPAIRSLFDLAIFVDCPAALRLQRRLNRDMAERGRCRASIQRQFRELVGPMHEMFVAPQARRADVILQQPLSDSEVHQLCDQLRALPATGSLYPGWTRDRFRADAGPFQTNLNP